MNEFDNINYSDLIYKFIDGDISQVEQTILFNHLSENSELQQEFQQAVAIQKAFEFDKMVIGPSLNLTNRLFSKAGFTSSLNTVSKLSNISNFVKPVLFALFGVILTGAYFLFIVNDKINENLNLASIPQHKLLMKLPDEDVGDKNINSNQFKRMSQSSDSGKADSDNRVIGFVGSSISDKNISICENELRTDEINSNDYQFQVEDNRLGAVIEVRGISGLVYLPDRTIIPQESKIGNNISLSIMKKIDEKHSIGVIAGQEALQLYAVIHQNGEYNFELQPNLFWLGGVYRYSGREFFGTLRPFTELMLGGSKYGAIGKFTAGLLYNPQDFISMTLGVETTALMYKYSGSYNFTEKFSIIYGLGIHF